MDLISTNGFPARWNCGSGWGESTWLGWLHIFADVFTFLAYYAVPAVTVYFVFQKRNVKLPPIFYFFLGAIFLTCGTGHLLEAVIFYWPIYRLAGFVKLLTAVVSCAGVVLLARILPKALELKTGEEFERVRSQGKEAEQSLEHERFLLRTLLEHLPDAIYFKDAEGRFTLVSQSLATRLGCASTREVLGKTDADFFSSGFAAVARADEEDLMRSKRSLVNKSEQVHWPGNGDAWVSTTKAPLHNEAGQIVGTFGISHDVTALKAKEEALRISEERFALAVRGSNDGIWDWDIPTDNVYYAPRFLELLGFQEHEFPGCLDSFKKQLHPEDYDRTFAAVDAHLQQRIPFDVEYRLRLKSGEYRWFRARGQALWDDSGRATRMAGSITDITDRHLARERLQGAIDASPTALVKINQSRQLTLVNTQAARLFGYAPGELLGKEIEVLIPERFHAQHPANVNSFFANRATRQMGAGRDLWGRKKDGTEFPVEVGLSPLELEGETFVLAGIVDITERRRALDTISQAKEAAEASNRAKSEFLANMSHEIRTPMNAVIGMTELVLDTQLTASQREYLTMVLQGGESLMTIINDILDFSKIESGKIAIEAIDFAIWDLLGDTMKSLSLRAHSKGLELAYQISQEIPEMLVGDPIRLRQILINLVGNAIKFTEQGEVVVNVSCTEQNENGVELQFAISDTGMGIPSDKQTLIFDAFSQADSSITRRFGGTGLGLAISSRLASLMGGELVVHSEVGRGSTFSFSLWFARSQIQADSSIHVQPDLLRDKVVMIVDDNATNRRILDEMVRSWGMIPLLAFSAADALQQLHQRASAGKPVPLLLTDVHMPEMDGLSLVEQLRGIQQYAQLPVIVLSSGDFRVEAERSARLAVAAHLTKPVRQSELLTSIENALSNGHETHDRLAGKSETPPAQMTPLKILLAEDGLTNQKLATALLHKWGHQVTVASNGREALHAYQSQPFDLVLMDVQMPEMDGLEATAAIRALEEGTPKHIPIVAMTARAMKGDRERCLNAGMDGYVAKPIRQRDLYQAIAAHFAPTAPGPAAPLTVDWPSVLMEVENDRQILTELIQMFLAEGPRLMAELIRGVQNADALVVRREAHTLKSSLQIFGAGETVELAEKIEALGRSGDLHGIAIPLEALKLQMEELRKALESYLATSEKN